MDGRGQNDTEYDEGIQVHSSPRGLLRLTPVLLVGFDPRPSFALPNKAFFVRMLLPRARQLWGGRLIVAGEAAPVGSPLAAGR